MGVGKLYLRNLTWYLDIGVRGKRHRVSTGVTGGKPGKPPKAAELFRAEKLSELGKGNRLALSADRVTFEDVAKLLEDRATVEERAALPQIKNGLKNLGSFFAGWKAVEINAPSVLRYGLARKTKGYAVATINTEIGYLCRALGLAVEYGLLGNAPKIRRLPGARIRRGLIADADLQNVIAALPERYRPVVRFLRWSGWRASEALGLEWRCVDWASMEIRLENSKTGEPRAVPFGTYTVLREVLEGQRDSRREDRLVPYVFPDLKGQRMTLGSLNQAWRRARSAAPPNAVVNGKPTGPLLHDLRRTFISWADEQGLPWAVQKAITGHVSDQVHANYRAVPRREIEDALAVLKINLDRPDQVSYIGGRER